MFRLIVALALVVAAAADSWCSEEPYNYLGDCNCFETEILPATEEPGVMDDAGWTPYGCTVLADIRWQGACASDPLLHSDEVDDYINGGCVDEGEVDYCGLCTEGKVDPCDSMENECAEACGGQYGYDAVAQYLSGGKDSECCKDSGGCSSSDNTKKTSESGVSEDCMEGCIEDCYGNDDFLNGDRWNKEQCVCLVTDCYDSRDCDDNDVAQIEGFVATGCGAEDSSYDYSYDYRDVEDIADEWDKDSAGALGLAVGAAVVAALAM